MLASARLFHTVAAEGARHGVVARGLHFDWAQAQRRKNAVVQAITGGGKKYSTMLRALGVEVIVGEARVLNEKTIQVGKHQLTTKAIVIAAGATDAVPEVAGIQDIPWLTYKEVLQLPKLPASAMILGGGAVAIEMATLLGLAGVPVTILEQAPHLLPREDEEVATLLTVELQRLGVAVHTGALPLSVQKVRGGIACTWQQGTRRRQTTTARLCIVAAGRRPNLHGLDLEAANIALNEYGTPKKVSAKLAITKNIFIAGDANAQPQFTATAHHAGWIAGWNAAHVGKTKQQQSVDWSLVPRVIFSHPEYAAIGLSAQQAAKTQAITIKRAPVAVLARAAADGSSPGVAKIILNQKTGRILGAHILAPHAGEIIHEIALAMRHNLTWAELTAGLRAFPSYSELLAFAD
jgi:pyruvate/2-oxoglutarate dehydrogenase complex dihydrolipoamide dehydrogenase (E3) component